MNKDLLNKIKELLNLPTAPEQVTEEKVEEVVSEVKEESTVAVAMESEVKPEDMAANSTPDSAPAAETPAESNTENTDLTELTSAVADLQARVANLEAMLGESMSELKTAQEAQEKLKSLVELIAAEPSGEPIKKTASAFSLETPSNKKGDISKYLPNAKSVR